MLDDRGLISRGRHRPERAIVVVRIPDLRHTAGLRPQPLCLNRVFRDQLAQRGVLSVAGGLRDRREAQDFTVHHVYHAVRVVLEIVVMCYHDASNALAAGQLNQQTEDDTRALGVQIAGRLIKEQHVRAVRDGARDGDALLFAA